MEYIEKRKDYNYYKKCNELIERLAMDNKAKPATSMPVTAPDLKATESPFAKPFLEASAVLTLA